MRHNAFLFPSVLLAADYDTCTEKQGGRDRNTFPANFNRLFCHKSLSGFPTLLFIDRRHALFDNCFNGVQKLCQKLRVCFNVHSLHLNELIGYLDLSDLNENLALISIRRACIPMHQSVSGFSEIPSILISCGVPARN